MMTILTARELMMKVQVVVIHQNGAESQHVS